MSRDEPGLPQALSRLGSSVLMMLQHRLELASIELGESGGRFVTTIVASFVAMLLFGGAVFALSAWVVVVLWGTLGATVLWLLALVYALSGAGVLWWLRGRQRRAPALLADTFAELRTDAAHLRGEAARAPGDAH